MEESKNFHQIPNPNRDANRRLGKFHLLSVPTVKPAAARRYKAPSKPLAIAEHKISAPTIVVLGRVLLTLTETIRIACFLNRVNSGSSIVIVI